MRILIALVLGIGIGIAAVWFYSTKEGGTGLGLTVSYNIITAHRGNLELLLNHGKGACFRVFLPIGEEI